MGRLQIKAVPGSTRQGVVGWLGEWLKVSVRAPAEAGKANRAIEVTMAQALAVSNKRVRVVSGRASPRKTVEVEGLTDAQLRERIGLSIDSNRPR